MLSQSDLLGLDSGQVQAKYHAKELDSVGLVKAVLGQIKRHNQNGLKLRALISVAPEEKLLTRARALHQQRDAGEACGPLHGIPIIIKDCFAIDASSGLTSSAGSHALFQNRAVKSAPLVDKLLKAGAIIIGKSNLTELCAFKGDDLVDGFSPVGGQTLSPYVYGELNFDEGDLSPTSPGGSSNGSAVGVSAGFALIGIGTETNGSVVQPSSRQALYALKPTLGAASGEGSWGLTHSLDTPGVMARSVRDIAIVTELLLSEDAVSQLPTGGYLDSLTNSFKGMKIGFVDPSLSPKSRITGMAIYGHCVQHLKLAKFIPNNPWQLIDFIPSHLSRVIH